jgi:hypothetical protein
VTPDHAVRCHLEPAQRREIAIERLGVHDTVADPAPVADPPPAAAAAPTPAAGGTQEDK